MSSKRSGIEAFVRDIVPLFHGRRLVYVDVGAYKGLVFKGLLESELRIREALLIEPNPRSRAALQENLAGVSASHRLVISSLAVGARRGTVRMRSAESMTQVVAEEPSDSPRPVAEAGGASEHFTAQTVPLDELAQDLPGGRISLLKVDVEGFELQVLAGAESLLRERKIDVLYIEAGIDPGSTQQCYFRAIDDVLVAHGYRLFRIYEQMNEWIEDSPFLRRVNLAYLSPEFARTHPTHLTRELYSLQNESKELRRRLDGQSQNLGKLEEQLRAERANGKTVLARLKQLRTEHRAVSKARDALRVKTEKAQGHLKEKERAFTESEVRLRRARIDCAEMKLRHQSATCENQEQIHALARQQARVKELQRANEAAARRAVELKESLRAVEAQLADLEARAAALTRECSELDARLSQQQRSFEARLTELRQRHAGSATADAARLAQAREAAAASKAANDSLTKQIRKREREVTSTESVLREVFATIGRLSRSEQQAKADEIAATGQVQRIEKQLSYRVGSAVVRNARSPLGWLRMPAAVRRSYTEFQRDRQGLPPTKRTDFDGYVLAKRSQALRIPMDLAWQTVRIANRRTPQQSSWPMELWGRVLAVKPHARAIIDLSVVPGSPELTPLSASVGPTHPNTEGGSTVQFWTLQLRAGEATPLFRYAAGTGHIEVQVRKLRGVPAILRLEVRKAEQPETSPVAPEKATPSVTRLLPEEAAPTVTPPLPEEHPPHTRAQLLEEPSPVPKAARFSRLGELDTGLKLLVARGLPVEKRAATLLHANHERDDEDWLKHLNDYVTHFGAASIHLAPGGTDRYMRLHFSSVPRVDEGPLVSVIMAVHNGEKTLDAAARSILDQSWGPLELVIVDDASDDATAEVARRLASADRRVKLLRNAENAGLYVSRNVGLRACDGQFVTCQGADDWAHPQRIEKQVGVMLREGLKACISGKLQMKADGKLVNALARRRNADDGFMSPALSSCLFETAFFKERLGHWDSVRFGGDEELVWRARVVLRGQLPVLEQLGMICYDTPGSLSKNEQNGTNSWARVQYSTSFKLWHSALNLDDSSAASIPFHHEPRRFAAPHAILTNPKLVARLEQSKAGSAQEPHEALPQTEA